MHCCAQDMYDQPLTFSRGAVDTMMLALLRAVYSGRGDSQMVVSMEQALPLQRSWLNFNRLRIRADRTIPLAPRLKLLASAKGTVSVIDARPWAQPYNHHSDNGSSKKRARSTAGCCDGSDPTGY